MWSLVRGSSAASRLVTVMSAMAALSLVAMIFIIADMVRTVASGANQLDVSKTSQSVEAALSGILQQSSGLVLDNAKWDDAVRNSYGNANQEWLMETWGAASGDVNYDALFLTDEKGGTVAGFAGGDVFATSAKAYVGPAFDRMLATLPRDGKSISAATAFVQTEKGLSVVSVAPIVNNDLSNPVPGGRTRQLVISKTLLPEDIADLGKRLIIRDLSLAASSQSGLATVAVRDDSGEPLAFLNWTPDRPGDLAKSRIQKPAIIAMAGVLLCMLLFTVLSWRLSVRLQASEQKAWDIANKDSLTSLPNRHAANALLAAKLKVRKRLAEEDLVVMIADLDGFKLVNDAYGHQVGDDLIRSVAAGLGFIADKHGASLCRIGGDEFAVILDGPRAVARAQSISQAALGFMSEPFNLGGRIAQVGISLGIASDGGEGLEGHELLRRADVAMYDAKEQGKNRVCLFEKGLDSVRHGRISLAKALTLALAEEQISVAFQPIVAAGSQQLIGVEALARWRQADGSEVPPDIFIGVAEEFGLIDKVGDQVLKTACREASAWENVHLSVNISPAQFRNPDFVQNVLAIVDQSGFPRNRLELELTEGYLIEHKERAKPILEELQRHGIQIVLDDFGTGYSSIGYLRDYRFNRLKIDKSLIKSLISDDAAGGIVQAAALMAKSMRMSITAEGVELEEQASLLRLAGCDSLQGHYFGKAQPPAGITAMIALQEMDLAVA